MATAVQPPPPDTAKIDYSLIGVNSNLAVERGLAEADWYQCPVPRETMRKLLERRNGPAIRDTLLWFSMIGLSAWATIHWWGTWWAALAYLCYAVSYATPSDSRWHEAGHGTAFKTDWMNNALYEISSFMVMRESTPWRWSHTRHHSDTIIVGRDPEIAVPRPTDMIGVVKAFFNLQVYPAYFKRLIRHVIGKMEPEEMQYIPATEFAGVFLRARIHFAIHLTTVVLALYLHSWLPVLMVGLTHMFGSWLSVSYGMTQHAGLAENVLDHRLNCRTVYMNPFNRFMYLNMNYHVEHHMFPLVPYHALPRLHAEVKEDCPAPYTSMLDAWKEILPAMLRQRNDPGWYVRRTLPLPRQRINERAYTSTSEVGEDGFIDVCEAEALPRADAIRFDHGRKTYAIYRDDAGKLYATEGICTHGNTHLADGLVIGNLVECPKHNGRFNMHDGSPARAPICRGLVTYPVQERSGRIFIDLRHAAGAGLRAQQTYQLRVVSNRNVATFIKELILEPVDGLQRIAFQPGDYIQLDIPAYSEIRFRDFDVPEPYRSVWEAQHVFDLVAKNPASGLRNNYSIASNGRTEDKLRFNVRIATPPPGQECAPGVGSSYVFSLKPGDVVTAIGPFGEFHIKPTQREMIYIGGGAGMAPLRAHLAQLLENDRTARKVTYWYGARSLQEIYYEDYFSDLAAKHRNFHFHVALSSPLETDNWTGHTGFIHESVYDNYLKSHPNPAAAEFYLCGPPTMIKACTQMLAACGVPASQIAYDEF